MKPIPVFLTLAFLTQILLATPLQAGAQPARSGTLFLDRNGNGVRDRGERALKGISVSDGDTVVLTDRKGRYTLPTTAHGSVFPILPSGYEFPGGGIHHARFRYYPDSIRQRRPSSSASTASLFCVAAIGMCWAMTTSFSRGTRARSLRRNRSCFLVSFPT